MSRHSAGRELRRALGAEVAAHIAAGGSVRSAANALGLGNHTAAYSALCEYERRPLRDRVPKSAERTAQRNGRMTLLEARVAALEAKLGIAAPAAPDAHSMLA